jgi:ribonuclease PH
VLPGGEPFSTPQQLKEQLLQVYRKQITRNMIQRMLSYAIGRSLQPYDRITVDKIYQRIVKNDYRSSVLIREIINSPQFLCRQDEK